MGSDFAVQLCVIALVIYSTSLHEMAHAFTAHWLGDPTPGRHGRLTFNPLPHLSPVWTAIILPAVFYLTGGGLFCLAYTPVNPSRLRRPLRDYALLSLAGPVANFLFAAALIGLLWVPGVWRSRLEDPNYLMLILPWAAFWGVVLGVFNLLPIPPLDGYGVIRGLLPLGLRQQTDAFARGGMVTMVIAMMVGSVALRAAAPALFLVLDRLLPGPLPLLGG